MKLIKTNYYKHKGIENTAREIINNCGRRVREIPMNNPALLVLDMQDYFISDKSHAWVPSAEAVIPRINKLTDYFEKDGYPVIFTKHVNSDDNAGMMGIWWQERMYANHPLINIDERVHTGNHKIIEKSQYDAFYETELEDYLKNINIDTLIFTGVMTNLCCETTLRSAFCRGFNCIFPADTTATINLELHQSTFRNLAHGFAHIVMSRELMNDE
ncbi:MAG: isochorismatase family protein [Candidatus Kapaibacterium sp.]